MKETLFLEVRAAEGGDHSKQLVVAQAEIYIRVARRRGL
jgi:protein subunit release factor A